MTVTREFAIQIDEKIVAAEREAFKALGIAEALGERIQIILQTPRVRNPITSQREWAVPLVKALATADQSEPRLAQAIEELQAAQEKVNALAIEIGELNNVWIENGRWERAFLVVNANGHVHKTRACSTCFTSTQFVWLTEFSGATETEIVEAAGSQACTVCYPTAPAEVLNRPTTIVTADQKEKAAKREQARIAKEAREAARIAKAPTADGSPLRVVSTWGNSRNGQPATEELKTERTARMWWVDTTLYLKWATSVSEERRVLLAESLATVAEVLAQKNGVTPETIVTELTKKVEKKWAAGGR